MSAWAPRAAAASCSDIVHSEILIMVGFVKKGIGLSDKDASLLCGIFKECSLRQKVWRMFTLDSRVKSAVYRKYCPFMVIR